MSLWIQNSPVIVFMQNSVPSIRITSLYESKPSSVVFGCKTATLGPDLQVSMGPSPHLWFCMQNSGFWTQIANLYWSQISRVVLCLQSSVISPRTTCLYGSQPFSVVFECKTATFGAELQVCMGTRPHLSFCACKTAWLPPDLLVSMGPSPHLWFLHAKQRLLDQTYKSVWVPVLICSFEHT